MHILFDFALITIGGGFFLFGSFKIIYICQHYTQKEIDSFYLLHILNDFSVLHASFPYLAVKVRCSHPGHN